MTRQHGPALLQHAQVARAEEAPQEGLHTLVGLLCSHGLSACHPTLCCPRPSAPPHATHITRPGELMAEQSHCMCLMTQAEAAALTAFRAAAKGSSATVVASLQAGAADLFEKAAKVVREYTGERGGTTCVYIHTPHSRARQGKAGAGQCAVMPGI